MEKTRVWITPVAQATPYQKQCWNRRTPSPKTPYLDGVSQHLSVLQLLTSPCLKLPALFRLFHLFKNTKCCLVMSFFSILNDLVIVGKRQKLTEIFKKTYPKIWFLSLFQTKKEQRYNFLLEKKHNISSSVMNCWRSKRGAVDLPACQWFGCCGHHWADAWAHEAAGRQTAPQVSGWSLEDIWTVDAAGGFHGNHGKSWLVATERFFMFSPKFGEMIQFDEHIFQVCWNHQLGKWKLHPP